MVAKRVMAAAVLWAAAGPGAAAADLARAFGAMPEASSPRLSPSGRYVSFIGPGRGRDMMLFIAPTDGSAPPKPILRSGGDGQRLQTCEWTSEEYLWCSYVGEGQLRDYFSRLTTWQRLASVKRDGSVVKRMGRAMTTSQVSYSTGDGYIIYAPPTEPDTVLLATFLGEELSDKLQSGRRRGGWAVEKVNLANGRRQIIEQPNQRALFYLADQTGAVRLMIARTAASDQADDGGRIYLTRPRGSSEWVEVARTKLQEDFEPQGFDETGDWLYALKKLNGRLALYKIAADGSKREELIQSDPAVDIGGVVTVGGDNRVIGVHWEDEVSHIRYFVPEFEKLDRQLGRALKGTPITSVESETPDHKKLLMFAGSDRDPGRYYMLDRETKRLTELLPTRGGLAQTPMGEMRPITTTARDGAKIPGYLTLPPGGGRNLPLIVMPHGGPSARDSWGFDWLVQFYAAQGYAVVQPNYRGSSGFGQEWGAKTAIENWRGAINDVNDAARDLQRQGIADPNRTAIVGWSYGGYAALMANVAEPGLYKAAVAIAPVTDLVKLRQDEEFYRMSRAIANWQFGRSDSNLAEGSPARQAAAFRAPVLMFHGDKDTNVRIDQARDMDAALKAAGKRSELIVYPGLAHSLEDGQARADMLRRSAAFLEAAMGAPGGAAKAAE